LVAFYRMRPGSLSRQVWRSAVDGLEVMSRGCGPDPRVARPHPAHARGGPDEDLPMRRLCFVLWSAARDIAAGGDGLAIADLVAAERRHEFDPQELGQLMAAGMADMAACAPHALAPRWAEFEAKLGAVLDRLYPGAERARPKAFALGVIKAALNGGGPDDDDVIDLDDPRLPRRLINDPSAVLQLRRGGRTLGAVALAALGPQDPATFAGMVAAQAGRLPRQATVRAFRPWESWAFWGAAWGKLLRPAPPALILDRAGAGRARQLLWARLRTATAAGMRAAVAARLGGLPRGQADGHTVRLSALREETGSAEAPDARPPPSHRAASRTGACSGISLRVPILAYHRIAASGGLERYRVAPEAFAEQMALLDAAGFTTLTPEALAEGLERGRPFAGRPILLTFDDGYDDFYDTAWPVLQAHSFTATVFAVGGRLGRTADWDAEYGPPASLMSAERLRILADQGVSIGSHAFTHRRLTHLDTSELYREVLASSAALSKVLGRAPMAFCYPYGAHDPTVEQAVEVCGYQLGFSVIPGIANLASPPLRLPRQEVSGADDLEAFSRKLG
jgi:peptidoglycan/xylan/chitin deacetylase (PgdA/CDA1 family)